MVDSACCRHQCSGRFCDGVSRQFMPAIGKCVAPAFRAVFITAYLCHLFLAPLFSVWVSEICYAFPSLHVLYLYLQSHVCLLTPKRSRIQSWTSPLRSQLRRYTNTPFLEYVVASVGAANALYTHYSRGFSHGCWKSSYRQLCLYQHKCNINMARHRRKCETILWRLVEIAIMMLIQLSTSTIEGV